MRQVYYTLIFWLVWLIFIPILLKIVPSGSELIYVVVYSLVGIAMYFTIPSIFDILLGRIDKEKYQDIRETEQNKKLFFQEQSLRKKYKYIKLEKEENIINSNAISKGDKILLLSIVHGHSQEEIAMLFEKNKSQA